MLRISHLAQLTRPSQVTCNYLKTDFVKRKSYFVTVVIRYLCDSKPKKKFVWGSNKLHRNVLIKEIRKMADPKLEEILGPFRRSVKEQVCKAFRINI